MHRILTFDPGVTTGWVLLEDSKYYYGHLDDSLVGLFNFIDDWLPQEVAFEQFRYRPNQGHAELYSVQVIGIIRYWCELREVKPEMYVPQETKKFWTDEKIKKLGLWQPGMKHAMDALRVMLRYREDTDKAWHREILQKLR